MDYEEESYECLKYRYKKKSYRKTADSPISKKDPEDFSFIRTRIICLASMSRKHRNNDP